ncbi:MAG: ATP-binding cassette domain-containing protein [Bacilli bacterium]|jgi:oligopeptide transport system ATP-binding protein
MENKKEPILTFENVKVSFKRGVQERVVIEDLNLDVYEGEILGLVGESGSGKTTIGRTIVRVVPISGGEIRYRGKRISGKIKRKEERELKTKVQMIFQDPSASLNERSNVDYIISEGLRAFHLYEDDEDRIEKITEMMKRVGLPPEYLKRYPHEFSGGQRQRIGIARAMVMKPELVIADEPISALDVSIRAQVLNLLKEFRDEFNLTIIFIAHDLSVVKYISDRIVVINNGKIVEIASANRLFEMPLHPYTQALLTAVPIPDPQIERNKEIRVYHPLQHGYTPDDVVELHEVEPGHFVRGNERELARYKMRLQQEKEAQNEK